MEMPSKSVARYELACEEDDACDYCLGKGNDDAMADQHAPAVREL